MDTALRRWMINRTASIMLATVALVACSKAEPPPAAVASTTSPQSQKAAPLPDSDITQAIQRHFQDERELRSQHIQVAVTQGIATLTGSVDNLMASERALRVTQTIKGVRSVIDQVTVTPVARTDDQLVADVQKALHDDIATRPYAITVAAKGGKVTLTGTADSWQQKNLVAEVAKAVPGLKTIDDAVTVHYSMDRPSAEMLTDIKARLANDVWLDGDRLNVTVTGHTPRLSGTVASVAQALRARSDAWVAGTDAVDDTGVVVDWSAENDQRRATSDPVRSDSQIEQAVKDAFRFDARLKTFVPEVKVSEGAVVLTGTLDSAKARLAAASDARDTLGVWNVRNELMVQPSGTPSDADIVQDATRMIANDLPPGEAKSIQVSSVRGRVALKGTVPSSLDRFDAVDDAEQTSGVAEVENDLVVTRTSDQIKAAIEERLFWDPMVENNLVTVTVTPDGVATLTGTLFTWAEMKSAEADGMKAGATRIINLLKLNNHPEIVAR